MISTNPSPDETLFDGAVKAACEAVEIPPDDTESLYSMSVAVRAALRHIIRNTPRWKHSPGEGAE